MRHDGRVQLIEHPIRQLVPTDHNLSDSEVDEIVYCLEPLDNWVTSEIMNEYAFPKHWTFNRCKLFTFTANSEFQLIQYLSEKAIHTADKKMHAVAMLY